MKIIIKKDQSAIYKIETEKGEFVLHLIWSNESFSILIEEYDREQNLVETYEELFTLEELKKMSESFQPFKTIKEAFLAVRNQLDLETFGVQKNENKIVISFSVLSFSISLTVPQRRNAKRFYELQTKEQIEMQNLRIKELENELAKAKEEIQRLKKEKKNHYKEKEKEKEKEKDHHGSIDLNFLRQISDNKKCVNAITLLKDGRLASCSDDTTIKIYNLNTLECELTLTGHTGIVSYITSLKNGQLVSCSFDSSFKVWDIEEKSFTMVTSIAQHYDRVSKIIEMSHGYLASSSYDRTVKIWQKSWNGYECIKTLIGHTNYVNSVIETKDRKNIISGDSDEKLYIWHCPSYELQKTIEKVPCYSSNCLIESRGKIIVGGNVITIINLKTLMVETQMKYPDLVGIYSLAEIGEGVCLSGCKINDAWCFLSFGVDEYKYFGLKKGVHDEVIFDIIRINENTLASCSNDNTIKFWIEGK